MLVAEGLRLTKNELRQEIQAHSHIILCGHGSSSGLLSVGQFPEDQYIIDASMVSVLKHKTNVLYIWCYANSFVRKHNLSGFFTGLFLSETIECLSIGMEDFTEEDINESNYGFAEIVARHLVDEPPIFFYRNVLVEYGRIAKTNPLARYNYSRLYLNQYTPDLLMSQVVQNY